MLPDTLQVPSDITKSLIEDCEYYKIYNFKLHELVNKDFIDSFVKEGFTFQSEETIRNKQFYVAGEISLLSTDNWIDLDDCYCLTPTGILILSLNKETYQTFGIEGTLSHFHQKTRERYGKYSFYFF